MLHPRDSYATVTIVEIFADEDMPSKAAEFFTVARSSASAVVVHE
jgi:hypothetical protein